MSETLETAAQDVDRTWQPVEYLVSQVDRIMSADTNRNGFLSSKELDRAIGDPGVRGRTAAAIATLQLLRPSLKKLNADGTDDYKGISRADIMALPHLAKLHGLQEIATGPIFRHMDKNQDGSLSRAEVKEAMSKLASGTTRGAVDQMLCDFAIIAGEDDKITAAEISSYITTKTTAEAWQVSGQVPTAMQDAAIKIATTDRRLPDLQKGHKPVAEEVRQGAAGDCWFLAPIMSMAKHAPEKIAAMIKPQNPDGTITVEFPLEVDGKRVQVTVKPPTDGEIARYATAGSSGIWLTVMEKALGQYFKDNPHKRYPLTQVDPPAVDRLAPQEHLYSSVKPFGIELLTAEPATAVPLTQLSDAELDRMLKAVRTSPMTAISRGADWPRQDIKEVDPAMLSQPAHVERGLSDSPSEPRVPKVPRDPGDPDQDVPDSSKPTSDSILPKPSAETVSLPEESEDDLPDEESMAPKPPGAHDFGILDYDSETKTVTIGNPWGHGELVDRIGIPIDGRNDGRMRLSLEQVRRHFSHLTTVSRNASLGSK